MKIFKEKILYVILDKALLGRLDPAEAAVAAASGGADLIQYRDKLSSRRMIFEISGKILKSLSGYNVPLIINDYLDIAQAAGAGGVHLGPNDLPLAAARGLGGGELIIGTSVRSVAGARKAELEGADYLGVGSFYPTSTKPDAYLIDRDLFSRLANSVKIPVIAVGGIDENNFSGPFSAGASGVAVASALFKYPDITDSVRALKTKIDSINQPSNLINSRRS